MGYDPDGVQRLILEKLRQSSKGYSTVEDLIRDLNNGVGGDVSAMSLESKSKCSLSLFLSDLRYPCS